LNQADYKKIISGQKKGLDASLLRALLYGASLPYWGIINLRNLFYDKNILKSHKANLKVISIGNITAGGTGKTPLVIWLTNHLSKKHKCAILTRGYKSTTKGSDEANTLANSCPGVPVIVNPDRIAGAAEAVKTHAAEVLILDDAFQHRKISRDIDIITVDATCPFGYNKILPAGLLRESISSIIRAHAAIITRIDNVRSVEDIEKKLLSYNSSLIIAHSIHKPSKVIKANDQTLPLEQLKAKKVFAFCGLGNPDAFFNTVRSIGAEVAGTLIFDDHHDYTKDDIDKITATAETVNAELILTTQKDFVKLEPAWQKNIEPDFAYLIINIKITKNLEKITQLIKNTIEGTITSST
jgi:tetraacyldisaccharide 4'-kinase